MDRDYVLLRLGEIASKLKNTIEETRCPGGSDEMAEQTGKLRAAAFVAAVEIESLASGLRAKAV